MEQVFVCFRDNRVVLFLHQLFPGCFLALQCLKMSIIAMHRAICWVSLSLSQKHAAQTHGNTQAEGSCHTLRLWGKFAGCLATKQMEKTVWAIFIFQMIRSKRNYGSLTIKLIIKAGISCISYAVKRIHFLKFVCDYLMLEVRSRLWPVICMLFIGGSGAHSCQEGHNLSLPQQSVNGRSNRAIWLRSG